MSGGHLPQVPEKEKEAEYVTEVLGTPAMEADAYEASRWRAYVRAIKKFIPETIQELFSVSKRYFEAVAGKKEAERRAILEQAAKTSAQTEAIRFSTQVKMAALAGQILASKGKTDLEKENAIQGLLIDDQKEDTTIATLRAYIEYLEATRGTTVRIAPPDRPDEDLVG